MEDEASKTPGESSVSKTTKEAETEKPITIMAFYVFGFLIYAIYSLIISGAQDILAGTYVPTSAVLIANVGPYFVVTVVAPMFIQKLPYFPRLMAIFFLEATGLIMVVTARKVGVRILGISLSSFGFGLGELSFIAMTSFYHDTAASAFSAGTGTGISISPLYYTGTVELLDIHPTFFENKFSSHNDSNLYTYS